MFGNRYKVNKCTETHLGIGQCKENEIIDDIKIK